MNRHPPSTLKFRQLGYFVAEAEESKLIHAAGRLPASPTAVQQANLTLSTRPNELSGTRQHRPQKTQGGTRRDRCIVSLILPAANLQVIIGRRGLGKLTVIVKELESINATHVQRPRRNTAFSSYIE
jgi:hypothetical protein